LHTNASLLAIGAMLAKNPTRRLKICKSCDNYHRTKRLKTKSLAKLITTLPKEPFMKWGPIKPTRLTRNKHF
jgi:hypothetical protein